MLDRDEYQRMLELGRRCDELSSALLKPSKYNYDIKSELATLRQMWRWQLDDYTAELTRLRFEDTH